MNFKVEDNVPLHETEHYMWIKLLDMIFVELF